MNRKPLLGTLAGLALLSASLAPDRAPRLLYNRSASAPVAWYALKPSQHFDVGDLVAASLHEEAGVLATERGYLPPGIRRLSKYEWALFGLCCRWIVDPFMSTLRAPRQQRKAQSMLPAHTKSS